MIASDSNVDTIAKLIRSDHTIRVELGDNVFVFSRSENKWPKYKPEPRYYLEWERQATNGPWLRLPDEFPGAYKRVENFHPFGVYQRDYHQEGLGRFLRRMSLCARITKLVERLYENPYHSMLWVCGNINANQIRVRFGDNNNGLKLYSDGTVLIRGQSVEKFGLRLDENGIINDPMDWTIAITDHRISQSVQTFPVRLIWEEFRQLSQINFNILNVTPQ